MAATHALTAAMPTPRPEMSVASTFVDKSVVAGTTYHYVVTAAKGGVGESAPSNRVRISL